MHVAMVISTPFPPEEGIGYYTYNLSRKLLGRGHRVTVITRGGLRPESLVHEEMEIKRVPFLPVYPFHVDVHGIFVEWTLNQLESSPDVVHVHTPLTPAVEVDTPVVSTVHTSVVEDAKQIDSLDPRALANQLTTRVSSRRLIEAQSKSASAIATVAHSVKDELAEHFDISDVQVVGNGVNLSEFDGESDGGSESFGLFVGRLSYRKGIEDLIEAWERLPTEDRIPLKIVGKGPLREQLEKRISETALEEDIEFRGHVPRSELVRLYKQAELCMVPSHYEGLPTVLLEAMAARAPVVATAVSGALDVIEDGENGLLAPARDPDALRDAIQELLHDAEYRDRLATNGRDTIEREYTWEAVTDRYLDIYEESIS